MFPTRSDTNQLVQSQKQAGCLYVCNRVEEELYYSSSENKGADQLSAVTVVRVVFAILQTVDFLVLSRAVKQTCSAASEEK